MATGILHSHITVVILFILFMLSKNILMLLGMKDTLAKFRAKTKIADMVLGTLMLLTGGYLLYITKNLEAYMIVKILILFAVIPLGIIGFNKDNKILVSLASILLIYAYLIAKNNSLTLNIGASKPSSSMIGTTTIPKDTSAVGQIVNQNMENVLANAKPIFIAKCAICHGLDGKMKANGAKDLTLSNKTLEDRIKIISEGKNLMPGFQYQLSEGDIQALAIYTQMLKQ
ncbi:MAG: hypothetical protein EAZ07_09230 [Cytophagales bacterium]|nr:MAG: hypothetical protein EAZ07_09230 [Cytophagales bacterium]